MDPRQPFSFDWSNQEPTYDHHVHGLLGGPPPLASNSSNFQAPFQSSFQGAITNDLQANNDISMEGNEVEEQPAPVDVMARPKTGASRRVTSEHLDWNLYKDAIWRLYMDQNKTLSETMEAMDNAYSFKATLKQYKNKFTEWKWQKNLPTDKALVMTAKAKRRKVEEGKDTVFNFGGRLWDTNRIDSTIARMKRSRVSESLEEADTPEGVSYKTPKALIQSPPANSAEEYSDTEGIEVSDDESEDDSDNPMDSRPLDGRKLTLSWRGHSRTDLQDMWRMAINCRNEGKSHEAEELLNQVFLGMSHVLGKTNADTVKVAYNLADIYADTGRMNEAITTIEKMIEYHLVIYGCMDRRTQQHVLHAVELLNGWNRQADALGLLSLSQELLDSSSGTANARKTNSHTSKKRKAAQKAMHRSRAEISETVHSVLEDASPTGIDYGLGVVRTHVAAKDRAAEELLQAIISQCQDNPELDVQHLKAQAELLKLYDGLNEANEHEPAFVDALKHLEKAWEAYEWKEDSIESFDFLEAALQLIANLLKCGFERQARRMFGEASARASALFGSSDERTVWVLITIGLVYQTHKTWNDAEDWFEEAFSAALANEEWGPKDGIVKSLQNAMDHHHFSYVSDEGRPYKTIFGVSGITIRPGRLHLE